MTPEPKNVNFTQIKSYYIQILLYNNLQLPCTPKFTCITSALLEEECLVSAKFSA